MDSGLLADTNKLILLFILLGLRGAKTILRGKTVGGLIHPNFKTCYKDNQNSVLLA